MEYTELDLRSPAVLFNTYLQEFPKLGFSWRQETKEWTSRNLEYFRQLGRSRKSLCYPDPESGAGEYLVDLCWQEMDENGSKYRWLELVLEQEWSGNWEGIFHDFSKLVDIKANIKVFICFPKEAERHELPEYLAQWVSMCGIKHSDESYLVIIFSRDARRKESERLQIEGFAIDYRGEVTRLGSRLFPD